MCKLITNIIICFASYDILWCIAKINKKSVKEFLKYNYSILLCALGLIYIVIAFLSPLVSIIHLTISIPDEFSIITFGLSLFMAGYGQLSKEKEEITELNDSLVKKETENKELQTKINDLTQENNELKKLLEEKNKAYDMLVDKILDRQKEVCVISRIAKKIKK